MIDETSFPIRPGGGRIAGAPEPDMKGATAWYPRCKAFSSICPAAAKSQATASRAFAKGRASVLKKPILGFSTRFAAGESVTGSDYQSLARLIFHAALPRSV